MYEMFLVLGRGNINLNEHKNDWNKTELDYIWIKQWEVKDIFQM